MTNETTTYELNNQMLYLKLSCLLFYSIVNEKWKLYFNVLHSVCLYYNILLFYNIYEIYSD